MAAAACRRQRRESCDGIAMPSSYMYAYGRAPVKGRGSIAPITCASSLQEPRAKMLCDWATPSSAAPATGKGTAARQEACSPRKCRLKNGLGIAFAAVRRVQQQTSECLLHKSPAAIQSGPCTGCLHLLPPNCSTDVLAPVAGPHFQAPLRIISGLIGAACNGKPEEKQEAAEALVKRFHNKQRGHTLMLPLLNLTPASLSSLQKGKLGRGLCERHRQLISTTSAA